jgi:5'-nucleotidase
MGRAYYWIGGDDPVDEHAPGNDVTAIAEGHISVTPIHLNLTDEALQEALEQAIPWNGPPGSCTPLAAP